MDNNLTDFLNTFTNESRKPYSFLSLQKNTAENIKQLIKQLYDYTKHKEERDDKSTLPKLIVNEFDEEQVWQQLELQNKSCTSEIVQSVSKLSAKKDHLKFPLKLKCIGDNAEKETKIVLKNNNKYVDVINMKDDDSEDNDGDYDDEDGGNHQIDDISDIEAEKSISTNGKLKSSIVDDKFFKLAELELFLQNEEKNQDKPGKDDDAFDLFVDTDDGPVDYKYSDFFHNPGDDLAESGGSESGISDNENSSDEEKSKTKIKRVGNDVEDDEIVDSGDEYCWSTDSNKNKRKHDNNRENRDDISENEENNEKKSKKVRFSLLGSDDEGVDSENSDDLSDEPKGNVITAQKKSDKIKSSLEERQERLGSMIEKLEKEALSEKPWQLKGEVMANSRPQNSLLEEAVDFDLSIRPVPVVTEEVTLRLEDIIMQRIKDKAWDDVERKVKPVENPSEFKKRLALDQEKSKLSLAEVYEQEFIKQREATISSETDRQETEPVLHVEVRSILYSLFNKLDALSNYHYTPRPVAPEMKVISNVAAITMEEVAPVAIADSALLAPEEVKGRKRKGALMSKEERTDTDKKRARRLKKVKQRRNQRERIKAEKQIIKLNPGLGNKYSKQKAKRELLNSSNVTKLEESKEKTVRSSTAFFNKLQDEVKSQIEQKSSPLAKKKEKLNLTAKKLKL